MDSIWDQLAQRIVAGLDLQAGELIELRDHAGNQKLVHALLLAIESAGATPLLQIATAVHIDRLLRTTHVEHLANWDRHRARWAEQIDRIVVLAGAAPDFSKAPEASRAAFLAADARVEAITEARRLPTLFVAIPAVSKAAQLGIGHEDLERHMIPSLLIEQSLLKAEIERVLANLGSNDELVIRSGNNHELRVNRNGRPWLFDDGVIDEQDRERGAVVSNLPAGSIYTTVVEDSAEGSLALPVAGPARGVVLHFTGGRISKIEAATGGPTLEAMLDEHTGEPRRISHIGIGLNPKLARSIGWTIVDEHVYGTMFLALGENRYMGGHNESSLNVDYVVPGATLAAGEKIIIEAGTIIQ
jgi:leucyl aminopeptidase (aminopeptidase T)